MKKFSRRTYRIVVAYNETREETGDEDLDFLSEDAVKQEAKAVYETLLELHHQPYYLPLQDVESDIRKIREFQPDIIFNICEGFLGNASSEMHVAGLWELLNIPYTGNTPLTLGLSQNKLLTKKLLESKKIPTPEYQVYSEIPGSTFLIYPLIAKPVREDGSVGITQNSVIQNFEQLQMVVGKLLEKYKQPVLVEKFIAGREFNISILGNHPPRVLPVSEIDFSGVGESFHRITSYEAKWQTDHPLYQKTPAICPAKVSPELKRRLEDMALQVYRLLMGRDYSRVDIRADSREHLYVLEFNPNPDISIDAGFARALKAAGIPYRNFIETILKETLGRKFDD